MGRLGDAVYPYARASMPYFCMWCGKRSPFPLNHKTLGHICQHCLRPFGPVRRPRVVEPTQVLKRSESIPARPSLPARIARAKSQPHGRKAKRLRVLGNRDGWICQLCGQPVDRQLGGTHPHRASADHIVRLRNGGFGDLANLRLTHQSCNEFREGANIRPFAPFVIPMEEEGPHGS